MAVGAGQDGADEAGAPEGASPGFRCDFCGETVPRVRRIALDQGYERLQTPHAVRYACEPCSREKEDARRGERRG